MNYQILNCASIGLYFPRMQIGTQCLLVVRDSGLLLVDTGLGTRDFVQPPTVIRVVRRLLRQFGSLEQTAHRQLQDLGFAASDVDQIVMTHMHLDHAGGLSDFPDATVHVFKTEWEAAMAGGPLRRYVYIPDHWAHGPRWQVHDRSRVQDWFGFDSIPVFSDAGLDVRLIPLPGHTRGHCGVAIGQDGRWLLHCGDAVALSALETDPRTPSGRLLGPNLPRLRQLRNDQAGRVELITAHIRLDRPPT